MPHGASSPVATSPATRVRTTGSAVAEVELSDGLLDVALGVASVAASESSEPSEQPASSAAASTTARTGAAVVRCGRIHRACPTKPAVTTTPAAVTRSLGSGAWQTPLRCAPTWSSKAAA